MRFTLPRPRPNRQTLSLSIATPGFFTSKAQRFSRYASKYALPVFLLSASLAIAHAQISDEARATQHDALLPPTTVTATAAAASALFSSSLNTPDPDQPSLPNAPDPQAAQTQSDRPPSSKRIFGIIPNFRTVSTDEKLPPMSVKDKYVTAFHDSFDYSSIFIPAAVAGYSLALNSDPEFGSGGVGYARYLWHSVVDQTSENFLVEAIVPSITHEDPRFYTLARGSATKRIGYALTRAVVTRSDDGRQVFNASEVFGSGISAGLSNLYYPSPERTFGNTGKQWGTDIGIDAIAFVVKEFAPDLAQKFMGTPKRKQ